MNNIDYYILCVLEMSPKFNNGKPFNTKELAYYTDLDKSEVCRSIKILHKQDFVILLGENPKTYSYNKDKIESFKNGNY